MDDEKFKEAALMEDSMDTGRGAGAISALFFMFFGMLIGLAIGYFIWH